MVGVEGHDDVGEDMIINHSGIVVITLIKLILIVDG